MADVRDDLLAAVEKWRARAETAESSLCAQAALAHALEEKWRAVAKAAAGMGCGVQAVTLFDCANDLHAGLCERAKKENANG